MARAPRSGRHVRLIERSARHNAPSSEHRLRAAPRGVFIAGPSLTQNVARTSQQPLVLSLQASAAGRHQPGAAVGLHQTGQRLTSILIPPLMGGIADRYGISESFVILGGLML